MCSCFTAICTYSDWPTCTCLGCTCSYTCCSTVNLVCCDVRYFKLHDIILFVSLCPPNCLNCTSANKCNHCDTANKYYLSVTDSLCYLVPDPVTPPTPPTIPHQCPQSTYPNATTTFQLNAAYQIEFLCMVCNATCLECTDLYNCTKCYTLGRNESFFYNYTCINPCINGHYQNYSTHECYCPPDYHFLDTNVSVLYCYTCSYECLRCFGLSNINCTACTPGFYLANGTTSCLN